MLTLCCSYLLLYACALCRWFFVLAAWLPRLQCLLLLVRSPALGQGSCSLCTFALRCWPPTHALSACAVCTAVSHCSALVGTKRHPRCFRCHTSLRRRDKSAKATRGQWPNKYCTSAVCSADATHQRHAEQPPCSVCQQHMSAAAAAAPTIAPVESAAEADTAPSAARASSPAAVGVGTKRSRETAAHDTQRHVQPRLDAPSQPSEPLLQPAQAESAAEQPLPPDAPCSAAASVTADSPSSLVPLAPAGSRPSSPVAAAAGELSLRRSPPAAAPTRAEHLSAAADPHPDCIRSYSTRDVSAACFPSLRGRRFVLDYPADAADPLPPLLRALGASIVPRLEGSTDELVLASNMQPRINTSVMQSRGSRMAQWQKTTAAALGSALAPLEDRRAQAARMQCTVHAHSELLHSARQRQAEEANARPCIIIGDEAGMYKPQVTFFPILQLPVSTAPQRAHAASPALASKRRGSTSTPLRSASPAASAAGFVRVHTLPMIDWNAPAGRSPFVQGVQRSEEIARQLREQEQRDDMDAAIRAGHMPPARKQQLMAAQAVRSAATSSRVVRPPAPKLLWCEVCRVHCECEQTHHNSPAHQRRFDSPQQLQPLLDELHAQRRWNYMNHFMEQSIRSVRAKLKAAHDLQQAGAAAATAE